jgi:hypothetical protein
MKDLLDGMAEQAGDAQRQWERRVVAARLDGVHRLPGHPEETGQLALGEAPVLPQPSHVVAHLTNILYRPAAVKDI